MEQDFDGRNVLSNATFSPETHLISSSHSTPPL